MPRNTLNLRNLSFLVADPNPFSAEIVHTVLRNFTANSIYEAGNAKNANEIMHDSKVDALLCDDKLPDAGGIEFAKSIRRDAMHPCRSIPILIMAGEAKPSLVKAARDAGANLVVCKPIAPSVLFDRLLWIAYRGRRIVEVNGYFGPDRRFRFEAPPQGNERRNESQAADTGTADASGKEAA
jgi:two-component system, chemotaxis family, chemotaxis protein CheY